MARTARTWRPATLGAVIALVAAFVVVAPPSLARAADSLLSQGRPATASSTEQAGTPASAAVDGNTGSRWSSAFSDPQWLQVDLGATATISRGTHGATTESGAALPNEPRNATLSPG